MKKFLILILLVCCEKNINQSEDDILCNWGGIFWTDEHGNQLNDNQMNIINDIDIYEETDLNDDCYSIKCNGIGLNLSHIYPNPANNISTIQFQVNKYCEPLVYLIDENADLVRIISSQTGYNFGYHALQISLLGLSHGYYRLIFEVGECKEFHDIFLYDAEHPYP